MLQIGARVAASVNTAVYNATHQWSTSAFIRKQCTDCRINCRGKPVHSISLLLENRVV